MTESIRESENTQTALDQGATSLETDSCGQAPFDAYRSDNSGGAGRPYGHERPVPGRDGVQSPAGMAAANTIPRLAFFVGVSSMSSGVWGGGYSARTLT